MRIREDSHRCGGSHLLESTVPFFSDKSKMFAFEEISNAKMHKLL